LIKKYDFQYTIIGDGPQKKELESLIRELNLESRITFIKYTNQVSKILSEKDVFLQGSYVEGFPNSVLESCVVGTPVLAFNAVGGTKEIITDSINGYLVNNQIDFINKLQNLDEVLALDPEAVSLYVNQKFGDNVIIKKYEKLFDSI
jgi:glycosyltransferase involved in cell wall biosynthesis